MAQMNTDAAVLAKEAANFERISGELKGVIAQVESTAGALAGQWHGQAGTAAQAALVRFHEAAARQVQELNDISANIHTSGVQYTSTDEDQSVDAVVGDEPLTNQPTYRNGATDMTEQLWNFAGIEGGASEIQGSVADHRRPARRGQGFARGAGRGLGWHRFRGLPGRPDALGQHVSRAERRAAEPRADHQRGRCNDGSDRSRRHRDVRLTRRSTRVGGLDRMADLAHLTCVRRELSSNERYPCRPTMTGSSTPRADAVQTADEDVDRDVGRRGADAHRWTGTQRSDAAPDARRPEPRPRPRRRRRRGRPRSPRQMPPTPDRPPQRAANGMMRAPQSTGPAGARFEQPRSAPTPPPRPAPAPAPSQHFAEAQSEAERCVADRCSRRPASPRRRRRRRSAITVPSTRCRMSG